jgi:hypothetical protein
MRAIALRVMRRSTRMLWLLVPMLGIVLATQPGTRQGVERRAQVDTRAGAALMAPDASLPSAAIVAWSDPAGALTGRPRPSDPIAAGAIDGQRQIVGVGAASTEPGIWASLTSRTWRARAGLTRAPPSIRTG